LPLFPEELGKHRLEVKGGIPARSNLFDSLIDSLPLDRFLVLLEVGPTIPAAGCIHWMYWICGYEKKPSKVPRRAPIQRASGC
jgi:hypothetical protein